MNMPEHLGLPRVHVWHKLSTGELKKKLNMDQHLTLNTFKKVKQIQELITEEVTELFLLLLLSLLLLFLKHHLLVVSEKKENMNISFLSHNFMTNVGGATNT